jgi:hypothetical protein
MDDVPRIGRMPGPRKIAPNDLPDLVTFADVNDPKSVIEVDRNDLRASLGPNITWKRRDHGQRDEIKGRSSCRSAPSSKMEATTHEKYPAPNHSGPTMIGMRPTEGRRRQPRNGTSRMENPWNTDVFHGERDHNADDKQSQCSHRRKEWPAPRRIR